ncbi:MAG: hypothetical protein KJ598_02685, partial [Nanoarchaeota archaeon]|nr:hypothetical protein [Nanoarchaeota archaeon]
MALSEHFWKNVREYVRSGNRVAELYHGENDDILGGLARIVSDKGMVYGVDRHNPFESHENMQELQKLSNVRLLKASIPPLPTDVDDLDALFIREFIWTYPPSDGSENPQTYAAIDKAINVGGHLILHLNSTEQEIERGGIYPLYQEIISRQLPLFQKVYDCEDLLIYQK